MMFLKDRDWTYPLEKLDRKFDEHYDVTAEKFHMTRSDFLIEWRYLKILWGRLQEDFRIFYESQPQIEEGTVEHFKNNMTVHRLLSRSLDCIHLDTNCFILNARILMDRVAHLTTFFWKKISTKKIKQEKFRSFEKLKKKIRNLSDEGEIIDKEYVQYVIESTDWFDNKLRTTRNELVTHRDENCYVEAFKPDSGTVLKGKAVFKGTDRNAVVEYVMREMPDLNELMDSICNFLNFFDEHFSNTLGS